MTLRHMMIFRAVCEADFNSTKAAEKLHMSQPAVSLAIKELEEYYGIKLFDRLGRRLHITDVGKNFLQYAVHICDMFNDLETGLLNWDTKGILRVGASITIGSQFLPNYVRCFSSIYPQIDVRVVVDQSDRLEKMILNNEIDFALIEGVANEPDICSIPYMEDHLSVVCPVNSKWKQGQTISVEEFKKQRFLLREHGSGTREVFETAINQAGFSVTPVWQATSTTALVNAVINGLGIAVLPHRMILTAIERGLVISVNVEGLKFQRNFYIVHHNDKFLTSSAKKFIELCQNYEIDNPLPHYNDLL